MELTLMEEKEKVSYVAFCRGQDKELEPLKSLVAREEVERGTRELAVAREVIKGGRCAEEIILVVHARVT